MPITSPPGTIIDSISFYTHDLTKISKKLLRGQAVKVQIGEFDNQSIKADYWITIVADYDQAVGDAGRINSHQSLHLGPKCHPFEIGEGIIAVSEHRFTCSIFEP